VLDLTEEQSESIKEVEEKEEKRKLGVISRIDDLLGIQGQAYMKGQLKESLILAHEIIELAKPEDLKSFIKEQEELIKKIEKLLKEKEEKERERLRTEQEKLRLEKIKKTKTELLQLEHSFYASLSRKEFLRTEGVIETAKNLLSNLDDNVLQGKWEDFEKKFLDSKMRAELIEKAKQLIEESINLKAKFLFNEIKEKLNNLIIQLNDNGISDYLDELEYIKADIIKSEKVYLNIVETIEDLKQKVKNLQKEGNFKQAISDCEHLIKLAESVKKENIVEEYSNTLINLKEALIFEELKETIKKLNTEGLVLLKKGELLLSLEKFKKIQDSLKLYIG